MSAGHAVGGAAFICYLLAVVLDAAGHPPPLGSLPPSDGDQHPELGSGATSTTR